MLFLINSTEMIALKFYRQQQLWDLYKTVAFTFYTALTHSSFQSECKHDKRKVLCLCVFGLFHLSSHKPQLLSSLQSTETHLIVFHIVFKLHSYRFFFVSPSKWLKLKPRHLKRLMCFFGPRIFTKKKKKWEVSFWRNGETVDWVAPPNLPAIWGRTAQGSGEEPYISFCFRYVFAGANHQAGFSPWRAIGWFNTMTTGKQRQAANRVQSQLN